jgi:hypothetical protein
MHTKRVNYNWNVYVLYTDIICTNVGYKNLQNAIGFGGKNVYKISSWFLTAQVKTTLHVVI